MNIQFEGKTVIVTGAAHGFGRAIAKAFALRSASVWACDVLGDELEETLRICQDIDGDCHVRVVNVRDRSAVFSFVDDILEAKGAVHILVNNAGGVLGQVGSTLWKRSVKKTGTASLRSIHAAHSISLRRWRRA